MSTTSLKHIFGARRIRSLIASQQAEVFYGFLMGHSTMCNKHSANSDLFFRQVGLAKAMGWKQQTLEQP